MAENKDVKRGIVLYIDGKQVENSAKGIQSEMRKVKKEIDQCAIGSDEYVRKTRTYQELNTILREHRAELAKVKVAHKDAMTSLNEWWNKWQLAVGAAAGVVTAAGLAISKFRKDLAATESSQANLKALTGLDDDSIEWLTEQANELSTTMDKTGLRVTQSAKDILEAYMLVGSAKPELLSNKEALNAVTVEAMRLSQAAKMNLKDAVDGVTLAMNQYGASAEEAARYVNVLAAGSKMGAAGVESQTAAIVKAGVAASTAKVPIETLVGSIETLAEKGIKGEVAGTGLKTFFLKLEGMADDVRPSVVGLETALDNLRKKNMSTAEMQKTFGLEAYTVAQTMINGAAAVRSYTAAVTDTNVALEQAAINSDTAEAKLAQLQNEMSLNGQILVKELNPEITKLITGTMHTTRYLVELVRWMTKHRTALGLATAAMVLYVSWINRKIIADQLQVMWNDKVVKGLKAVRMELLKNPYAAVALAVSAVVIALVDYNEQLKKVSSAQKAMNELDEEVSKRYADRTADVELNTKILHDNTLGIEKRREALAELKKVIPDYHASLTEEGKLLNDNTAAIDEYLKAIEKEIRLEAAREQLSGILSQKLKNDIELRKEQVKLENAVKDKTAALMSQAAQNIAGGGGYAEIGKAASNSTNGINKANTAIKKATENINDLKEKNKELLEEYNVLYKVIGENGIANSNSSIPDKPTTTPPTPPTAPTQKEIDARIKKEVKAIETEFEEKANIEKKKYAEGKITRMEYNNALADLDMQKLNKLMRVHGLEESEVAKYNKMIIDKAVELRDDLDGIDLTPINDDGYAKYHEAYVKLEQVRDESLNTLERNLKAGNISEQEMLSLRNEIEKKFNDDSLKIWDDYQAALRKGKDNTEKILKDTSYSFELFGQKLETTYETVQSAAQSIGDALGKDLAESLAKGNLDLRDAFKSMLNTMLDFLEKLVLASIAQRTVSNVGTLGFVGMAKAAGEAALITAAFEAAKGVIAGFSSGGYTGQGSWSQPAGIVHNDEFVANRFAVANPAVKSVLDIIDNAQRNGTVANLSPEDLSSISRSNGGSPSRNDAAMAALIARCSNVMESLENRLKQPIVAETYATGKGGVNEAQELVNRMKRNVGH